jgi:hypothetical protein
MRVHRLLSMAFDANCFQVPRATVRSISVYVMNV